MFRALVFALGAGLARTDGRVTSRSKSQPEKIPPLDRSLLPWLGAKNEYYRRINRTREGTKSSLRDITELFQ